MTDNNYKEDIEKALATLRAGGIIIYPTDTIWGIGCDASNPEAVDKIYKIKGRADSKAMLALVGSDGQLQQFVSDIPDIAWELIDAAVNPLTIIYDHPQGVADNLKAPDGSLGVRISSEKFSSELCRRLRKPIVSTSANFSGKPSPKTFGEIDPEILKAVDYVVEYGREKGPASASNIIKLSDGGVFKVIR